MSQEKTEQATPRRRRKAREEGQVAKSRELTMAVSLLLVLIFLFLLIPAGIRAFQDFLKYSITGDLTMEFTVSNIHRRAMEAAYTGGQLMIPTLVAAAIVGLIAELGQVGFLFTTKVIQPKFNRLNPLKGLQRIFSKRAFVELTKALMKAVIFGGISYIILSASIPLLVSLYQMPLQEGLEDVAGVIVQIGILAALFQIFVGLLDYVYQRYEHEKGIRMSKKEVRDEYKETEGDPQIQSKIKERQRQMAQQRMMAEVPEADVVITNPTHLAIALKYDQQEMGAPRVVAKGSGEVARRIVDIARRHGVEVVQERALAQALYRSTEVGEEIPADLYQAVAEVLAFVYRLQKAMS